LRTLFALVVSALGLLGCVGPPALHDSVLGYDEVSSALEQEILLLNIARLSHNRPPHFSVTSSIAATFNFETSSGISGSIFEPKGTDGLTLNLSASAAENPTFSITPIGGQEFTERILTPVDEGVFAFFMFQGVAVELLARLMADGIDLLSGDGRADEFVVNKVSARDDYERFRRLVLHLGTLQRKGDLVINELTYEEVIFDGVHQQPSTGEVVDALKSGLVWRQNDDGTFTLSRVVAGRILISNYDPRNLSNLERKKLNLTASRNPENFVMIDVRPDGPGGEVPFWGAFKLRSLLTMIDYVGKGIESFPEFDVEPDPRTKGSFAHNPTRTMAVEVSETPPETDDVWVRFRDRYYSVGNSQWDRNAFLILYELYQVTVTDVSRVGIPITISK